VPSEENLKSFDVFTSLKPGDIPDVSGLPGAQIQANSSVILEPRQWKA
jgi:hypothetical protein